MTKPACENKNDWVTTPVTITIKIEQLCVIFKMYLTAFS